MFIEEVLYHIDEDYRKWCDTVDFVCEEILLEDTKKKDAWFFDMSPEKQQEYIKAYREAKKQYNAITDLPRLQPEPDYIIKTRPPMWDDWRLNIYRGIKENRLKMEANKIARRKCWETGTAFE